MKIPGITEAQWREQFELTRKYAPEITLRAWMRIPIMPNHPLYGMALYERHDGLKVIFTADNIQGDGKTWLHVSMSRVSRMPCYEDIKEVKALFIGIGRQALQIFPPESEHVNIHNFCLHLWCAVEGDGLPRFGKDGTI